MNYKTLIIPAILLALLFIFKRKKGKTMTSPLKSTKINSPFGMRIDPTTKIETFHNGIDLYGKEGTPIYSPVNATVNKVYSNDKGGNQLVILGEDNIYYGFAHLKTLPLLRVGTKIKEGQEIAQVGNTGTHTTGAHLHFVMRKGNTYLDPAKYFKF